MNSFYIKSFNVKALPILTNVFGDWLQGNMDVIDFLTGPIGKLATIVVSICGFLIVQVTIMRYSLAGLYVAFSTFWDDVHLAHQETLASMWGQNGNNGPKFFGHHMPVGMPQYKEGNMITGTMGAIKKTIYSFIPDVKAMTDFKDDGEGAYGIRDHKSFFLKGLGVAFFFVFIGVFIWFGYPSKLTEKGSYIATNLLDRFIVNFDPDAIAGNLAGTLVLYEFKTQGSDDPYDKIIFALSKEATTRYVGTVKDMLDETKLDISEEIEMWIQSQLDANNILDIAESHDYEYTIRVVTGQPDLKRLIKDDGVTKRIAFARSLADFKHGTTGDYSDKYLRVTVTFTKKSQAVNSDNVTLGMTLHTSDWIAGTSNSKATLTVSIPTAYLEKLLTVTDYAGITSGGTIYQNNPSLKSIEGDDTVFVFERKKGTDNIASSGTFDITGFSYKSPTGKTYSIKKVNVSGTTTSVSLNILGDAYSGISAFSFGDDPKAIIDKANGKAEEGKE